MAQYYQVTSLEELHRLYPNLKLDNIEGVQCMIQDEQVTQYTDGQGQVIATVEHSGMQLPQNSNVSQQCSSQQSQYIVQQPTQYVIQQMESNEHGTSAVQYIQQRPQLPHKKEEVSDVQFKDQSLGCLVPDGGNEENSVQQCVVKQDNNQQFVSQVQPILHQPVQIHQQIQGPNILVLHNQEQQDMLLSPNKRQELVSNQNQQEKQQPHIIIQRQQQQKSQQIVSQRPQIIQKEDSSAQNYSHHQALQNRRVSQSGSQQSQILHHPQQQIIHQLQYYNQVAVIDGFSQPNVTIDHHTASNENQGQSQQVQSQVQQPPSQHQYKQKKNVQQTGLSTVIQQPQQLLIPQRFDLSSPPPLATKIPQPRKKGPQHQIETSSTPVYIVQKLDSPFLIRQPQNKIRFQSPHLSGEKITENSYHSVSTQHERSENVTPENQQPTLSQSRNVSQKEVQENVHVSDVVGTGNKFPSEKNQNCGQVKIGIVDQAFGSRIVEQVAKMKVPPTILTRSPVARIKTTEQQTVQAEPVIVSDGREMTAQQCERFVANVQGQPQTLSTPSPQLQPPLQLQPQSQVQAEIQIPIRGRGLRIAHNTLPRGGHQYVPRARGVPVQTSPPRPPNAEGGGIGRRVKSPRGGSRGGRGGWVPCGLDQRQHPPPRPGPSQIIQTVASNVEPSESSNEASEDARMVVLLLNGEKKMVRIPCSQQNILLGQILQQAGLSLSSPASLAIEHVVDTSNSDQFVIKNNSVSNQQQSLTQKSSGVSQSVSIPNPGGSARSIVATIQQQRFRGHSPRLPQGSSVGIIRHRLQFTSPRVSSPSSSAQTVVSTNMVPESGASQSQATSNPTPSPPKEEPRFVSGCMAICPFCGISSLDFNKCIRCRRKLPENVKSQSIFSAKKKKVEKASSGKEKEDTTSEPEDKRLDSPSTEDRIKTSPLQAYDKKKPRSSPKKKKIHDEPAEILILSSDEEEETKSEKTDLNQQTLIGLKKEPIYAASEISEVEMNNIMRETNLNDELMKNVQPGLFTTLQCRTIKVGSYKVQPKERVLISTKAIRLVMNSLKNENATIVIPITNILKALIHFGKQIPVIFIYPLPKVGFQIRNILGMVDKMGPYYDPTSTEEETHKRITLLLEKITEDNKITLNKIFGQSKLEELSEKEANEILIRASAIEMHNTSFNRLGDSVRKIMVYPPPPEKGGITLNNQDYACLGEDQFLNDVIIDFYLKYLMLKVLSPEDRNRTHVFSTFFYKRLTTKPKTMRKNDPENDPKLSPAEKRHMRVKGWTKQVNLFEKDFIIVPINEHSHWFLAIICFPGLTGPVKFSDNSPVEPEEVVPKKNTHSVQIGNTTITHIIKSDGNTISLELDSSSDRDEAEGDQDDLHPSSDDESEQAEEESTATVQEVQIPLLAPLPQPSPVKDSKVKPFKRKPFKEPIKQPCILIFDSLAGASRVRVVATLRDYLKIEYKKKMGHERNFSKDTIKGAVPKVPQQNNFTDCGLYVLQYVESFFQDPLHDFKLPLKYLQEWFPEEVVSSKRQKLASLIRTLMEEQGIRIEEIGLPVLTFASGNSAGDDQSRMDEEEDEDEDEINDEDEEMLRNRVHISEFDNEDEDDMDLGEEEEEDDDDLEDDEDDEELEVGEIPRRWIAARSRSSCNELDSSVEHVGEHVLIKTSSLVDYEQSESDEDCPTFSNASGAITQEQGSIHNEVAEGDYCGSEHSVISENRKSVPLAELQDFESQISCTTIERNFDGKNCESDMVISEEDEECGVTIDEEEVSFETSDIDSTVSMSPSFTQTTGTLEKRNFQHKVLEVTDIIKKLVNDKNITISRKEDELNSDLFKKHLGIKRFKVKDCDKSEETKKFASPCAAQKNNLATCKRSYQALKSVRIPKKAERKVELTSKRQKLDER